MGKRLHSKFNTKQQESQQTKDTVQKEDPINCRICFQQMKSNELPNICHCKSTDSAIHKTCLSKWIKTVYIEQEPFGHYYTNCHVCKAKLRLTAKTQYKFISWKRMDFCQNQLLTTIVIIFIFIVGILMIGSSVFLIRIDPEDEVVRIISISTFIIGLLISILDILSFVYVLMIQKKITATGVKGVILKETQENQDNPEPEHNKNMQSPNDSYAKICIQMTSQQTFEDIID